MGYLAQPDLAFYHALADAFTICDGYFCSVLGPTDPNRLMLMSNSVGVGHTNGPLLTTLVTTRPQELGKLSWKTMPEALMGAGGPAGLTGPPPGISWKVYGDPTAQALFNVLPYFSQYQSNAQLAANASGWQYPVNFMADAASGTLPQVSWILPPAANCEHPAAPPSMGENLVFQILSALMANKLTWESTVFFVVYDENGGWFDHVPPPTPAYTDITGDSTNAGEWLGGNGGGTTTVTGPGSGMYNDGPVGLGFRTPCFVLSPFSKGGYVCSPYYKSSVDNLIHLDKAGTFDHTSLNRFIETVFNSQGYNLQLPNLSNWRKSVTGDFTSAFAGVFDTAVPFLPPAPSTADVESVTAAVLNGLAGTESDAPVPYPAPTGNPTQFPPAQDGGSLSRSYTPPPTPA
jgi:phospholipase C